MLLEKSMAFSINFRDFSRFFVIREGLKIKEPLLYFYLRIHFQIQINLLKIQNQQKKLTNKNERTENIDILYNLLRSHTII
jgi:hypothetical protein